jgi:hypothetical protein
MTTPFPVDAVADLLCSERYLRDSQAGREDVISFRFVDQGQTDDERRFEVHMETYGRTKTGKMDRKKTEKSVLRYRFENGPKRLHWSRHGKQGDKVVVEGVTSLSPAGDGTRIDRQATIKIKLPLIGRAIEKFVEREFRKGWANSGDQIARLLSEA